MEEVKCQYMEKCVSKDELCSFCKHNENRSYYEPLDSVPAPCFPVWDYWDYIPYYFPRLVIINTTTAS